jgi:ABC-type bacteriocin/lantibiotic exporter with double-glycine peptidase domain
MSKILRLLIPYWPYLGQALLISLLCTLLALPGPWVTKLLLDDAYPHRDFGLLYGLLAGGAAFAVFLALVNGLSGFFGRQVGLGMSLEFQCRFFRHVQGLDFAFFDNVETGDVLSRFDDLEASVSGMIRIVNAAILNGLQLLVFPAVLLWMHSGLALICLAVLPFDAVLAVVAGCYSRRYARRIAERSAAMSSRAVESLGGMRTIQSLGAEDVFYRRLRDRLEEVAVLRVRASGLDGSVGFVILLLRTAGGLAYGWYGWTQVLEGRLTVGSFLAFSAYAGYLYGPVQAIIALWPQLQTVRVHVDRFLEVYDRPTVAAGVADAIVPAGLRGHVAFHDVTFAYGDTVVLRNVDVEFAPGTTTALAGRSGEGKSTLAKLIPRFYDPQEGAITIDGIDVRRYDLPALRLQIGFVLQGACLFQGTIRDNLALGRQVDGRALEEATKTACIHDDILRLPQGYETYLGEGGSRLSAGQQHRLALARVLLLDTPILVLDEPTAGLDEETEIQVRAALTAACAGRTTILITHRPLTADLATHKVWLEDGRVSADTAAWTEGGQRCRQPLAA